MNAKPDNDQTVNDILDLKKKQMLVVNSEYQRGVVWTPAQKKKLVDSVLRGYPIPLIYFHHIRQESGKLVSERFEVIDGQQRINALSEYHDGAFKLFDPEKDAEEARFPEFIKRQPCAWGGKSFHDLSGELKEKFLGTPLPIVQIETHNPDEARDLFVRLQAGMPLNSQEKRDAWPGQFTDFILRLGGKAELTRYPGHDFFNVVLRAQKSKDRGKFRQNAAQIAVLYFTRRAGNGKFSDINAQALDDFYYENLGFDSSSPAAERLLKIFDKLTQLFRDQKRPKIIANEAIHLVLLVDTLLDDYTHSWEPSFAEAFDAFRRKLVAAKQTRDEPTPDEYWLRYGLHTRVNSDRGDTVQRRHHFFATKMLEALNPQLKDPKRLFGDVERELIYYRDKKQCAECGGEVEWPDVDIHHVKQHSRGGRTTVDNGALVHSHCHPKGAKAEDLFVRKWQQKLRAGSNQPESGIHPSDSENDDLGEV